MGTNIRHAWKDNIIKLMKAGNLLTQAANVAGVTNGVLIQELRSDAKFRAEVAELKEESRRLRW